MAIFSGWLSVYGNLVPGKDYRVTYTTICANTTGNSEFTAALAAQGIVTNNAEVSGPISTGIAGRTIYFRVTVTMPSVQFAARINAAFDEATKSAGAWLNCSTVEISALQEADLRPGVIVPGDGIENPVAAFQLGATSSILVIGAVAFLAWRLTK